MFLWQKQMKYPFRKDTDSNQIFKTHKNNSIKMNSQFTNKNIVVIIIP